MSFVNEKPHFICFQCSRRLPCGTSDITGYALMPGSKYKVCYDCLAKIDASAMMAFGKAAMYINFDPKTARYTMENWPGTLVFPVFVCTINKHNICGVEGRRDTYFWGPDGYEWHGVNISKVDKTGMPDNQVTRCMRLKHQIKGIKLQPLDPETYLKPYAAYQQETPAS